MCLPNIHPSCSCEDIELGGVQYGFNSGRMCFCSTASRLEFISYLGGYDGSKKNPSTVIFLLPLWKQAQGGYCEPTVYNAQYPATLVMHALHLSCQYKALNYQRGGYAKHCAYVRAFVYVWVVFVCDYVGPNQSHTVKNDKWTNKNDLRYNATICVKCISHCLVSFFLSCAETEISYIFSIQNMSWEVSWRSPR